MYVMRGSARLVGLSRFRREPVDGWDSSCAGRGTRMRCHFGRVWKRRVHSFWPRRGRHSRCAKLDRGGGAPSLALWGTKSKTDRAPYPRPAQSTQMATKSVSAAKPPKSVAAVAAPAAAPAAVVLPVSGPAGGGIRDEEFGGLTEERFISFIRGLTDEGRATVYALLAPAAAAGAGVPTKKRGPGRPKKEAAPTAAAAPLPAVEEGEVPDASEYRVPPDEIDTTICVGRILKGGEDKRWSPIIYREHQCGAAVEEGSDLCAVCARREQKYGETGVKSGWCGRVTEEPLDETHMLGTAWAEKKKPRFLGAAGAGEEAAEAASESGGSEATEKPKAKPGRKPMSAEAKAAKEAEKAAAKAAKEAEKAAAKAAKEAEKAATKAAKPKKAEKAAAVAPVAAAVAAAPEEVEGLLTVVHGNWYLRVETNLYVYDEATEKRGAYAGQFVDGDEPDIDMDAPEVAVAAESDTE